jgi:hypothetical protein
MNRPRESLLSLFDPLANAEPTSTPGSRDSVDLSSSDKENNSPPPPKAAGTNPALTMTKFFDRTYNRSKDFHHQPKPLPNGALIDVDLSMMDDMDELVSDEDSGMDAELEGTDAENSAPVAAKKSLITPRRRVLADIVTEDAATPFGLLDVTPVGFKHFQQLVEPSSEAFLLVPTLSPRPLRSVNCNPEALSVQSPPLIAVHSPTSASFPFHRRQSHSPSAAQRGRRESLDLHTSFNMNLRDTSFDLLNDRISFIGCDSMIGCESMGDIEFDMNQRSRPGSPSVRRAAYEDVSDSGIESDKGGFADVESDTDVELIGSLGDRLANIVIDADSDAESDPETEPANHVCLVTPKPATFSGLGLCVFSLHRFLRLMHTR